MATPRAILLVTIGQSPRDDVVPDIRRRLPVGLDILEAGALDGLDRTGIAALAPTAAADALVTRLSDGAQVIVGKSAVLARLQAHLDRHAGRVAAAVILCTGAFPMLRADVPLLEPDRIMAGAVAAIHREGPIGVIAPIAEQIEGTRALYSGPGREALVTVASPYGDAAALHDAARSLADRGVRLIALNCMGFSDAHKARVRAASGLPVLQPASLLAKFIDEVGV